MIGRPTMDWNMWAGKFEPAKPHLTNCIRKKQQPQIIFLSTYCHQSS